jgi:hypothetical protein
MPVRDAPLRVTLPPPFVVPDPTAFPLRKKFTVAPLTLPLGWNPTCAERFTVPPNVPVAAFTVVVVAGAVTTMLAVPVALPD